MKWCEANGVDYVFGFECNNRLPTVIRPLMQQAQAGHVEGKENPKWPQG